MQAYTRAPAEIFGNHIRYVVPLFQRPYVWNENDQWAPLWDDVAGVAQAVLDAPVDVFGAQPVPPHFLGAIVVEGHSAPVGFIAVKHVIDGQQRLTTLQLLLDAAQIVAARHGDDIDSAGLRNLILNTPQVAQQPSEVYKVWPTDRDQAAFIAAMDDDTAPGTELAGSPIVKAHDFFVTAITAWATQAGPDTARQRIRALGQALSHHLKLVVIELEPGDNAQVIFETLNHRGVDLLAADLVKNLLFQVAAAQGRDLHALYATYWKALDSDAWRAKVTQGRLFRPRIDLFLNHWLTMRLRKTVPTDRIFAVFRDDVVKAEQPDAEALMAELAADAQVYAAFDKLPQASVQGRFHYRVVRAMDNAVVSPFLLWVLRHDDQMERTQRDKALRALESWLVRRALVRASSKDVNNVVLDLLTALHAAGPATAGDTTEAFLAAQTADSRYWPSDDALRDSLRELTLYERLTRPRVRMLLEALEDELRGPLGEGTPCPRNLTVEHVMPQGWREHWGADIADDELAAARRNRLVHTIGNLTLVSGRLNPSMSNRPWTDAEAADRGLAGKGKRSWLLEHSELKLNAGLVAHEDGWNEGVITARTDALVDRMVTIWPRPLTTATPDERQPVELEPDATPVGPDEEAAEPPSTGPGEPPSEDLGEETAVAGHVGKYRALWRWLQDQSSDEVAMSFADVEDVLGMPLPPSARNHLPHWYGYEGTALGRAIRDAGWRASGVNLTAERVTFVRATE
jgi:hypothetical protein